MEFDSFDSGNGDEHIGLDLEKTSNKFAKQEVFPHGMAPFDSYLASCSHHFCLVEVPNKYLQICIHNKNNYAINEGRGMELSSFDDRDGDEHVSPGLGRYPNLQCRIIFFEALLGACWVHNLCCGCVAPTPQ